MKYKISDSRTVASLGWLRNKVCMEKLWKPEIQYMVQIKEAFCKVYIVTA